MLLVLRTRIKPPVISKRRIKLYLHNKMAANKKIGVVFAS